MQPWGFYKRERWKEKLKGEESVQIVKTCGLCEFHPGESPILIVKSQEILGSKKDNSKVMGKSQAKQRN